MLVAVAGSGRLAKELLANLEPPEDMVLQAWRDMEAGSGASIVVHAGSGRELAQIVRYCEGAQATLVELSTGSAIEGITPSFPVLLCPNTNILMLKFMSMVAACGPWFSGYEVSIQESHQSAKTSAPGTALALARSLGLPADAIESERSRERQASVFDVPPEHLDRHAVHRIGVRDEGCTITLEARVIAAAPYARGVGQLLRALQSRRLGPGLHRVEDMVKTGWL